MSARQVIVIRTKKKKSQETKTQRKLLVFQEMELSYISGNFLNFKK